MPGLPAHDPGYVRVGMQHTAAGDGEADGAKANLIGKGNQRAKVYGHIVASGSDGLTSSELHSLTKIERHVLSARLKELENDELIFKNGERRLATTGIRQNIYQATPSIGRLL